MTYKQIVILAKRSFTKNNIDYKKVKSITRLLKRSELKKYIKILKSIEKKNTVYFSLPVESKDKISKDTLEYLKKIFPQKNIEYVFDPSLMAGIRILDNDLVYDFSIKNSLKNLVSHIKQLDYD
ncbi:F0F1 ATP synthase subunit delta [Patescibacteria group bacterium]|nr:F0F1 ATP synthase subunit delta [Patescibacteria group bacterium]